MAKKFYWLKLKDNFFQQKEIKKLRKIAGGDTYTIIYLKLQLLSLENEGVLVYEGVEKDFAEQLSYEIDEDRDNIEITLQFMNANKLIEELEENTFFLPKINECIGKESESAERMRRMRARQKEIKDKNVTLLRSGDECDVTSVTCDTEKEKELEKKLDIEKDKKEKKKTKKEPTQTEIDEVVNAYTSNEELKATLIEFVKFRKSIKRVMTTRALELLIKKLDKLSNDDNTKIEILNESIMNGWNGIFPLKDNSTPINKNKGGFNNEPRSNTSKNNEPSKGEPKEEHDAKYWEEQNRILNEMLDF
ncbi:phage replisome organizer N-terminal domain-containing protein [Gemella morbillorum]